MKIWKLNIFWAKDNGVYHLHRDPRKGIKVSPLTADDLQNLLKEDNCQPETCAGQCQGMNSRTECQNIEEDESHAALPRHTPEELDRLIGTVIKVESPDHLTEEKE